MTFVVYKITNLLNGEYYHGKTSLAKWRAGYMGSGVLIPQMLAKYGRDNFAREIISRHADEKEAYEAEKAITRHEDPQSYNLAQGGRGVLSGSANPCYGKPISDTAKAKLSVALSGDKNPFYGKKHPPHIMERITEANTGRRFSPEVNAKKGRRGEDHPCFGKRHSESARQEMSVKRKGTYTGEANHFYGKEHTADSIQKMKDARQGMRWYYCVYMGKARTFVRDAIIPAGFTLGRSTKHFIGLFNPPAEARHA